MAQASPGDGGFAESGSLVELKHELSSPLMVIRWNLEVARGILQEDEATGGEDARARALDAIEAALQGMEHASRMVRAWRGARGSREAPARLDLAAVVAATVRMTRAWLEERAVVDVQVAHEALVVEGTETRLRQVLLNLFDNAYHALVEGDPARNRITIVARAQDDQVIIEVNDSGAGIEPSLVRQLGEPFVSARPGGTGLGLNLCSEIVWEHGGRLEIES
ncbi:MAG: HAMP domain-containing histidine kinase, partial [Myxococcales bacterium]